MIWCKYCNIKYFLVALLVIEICNCLSWKKSTVRKNDFSIKAVESIEHSNTFKVIKNAFDSPSLIQNKKEYKVDPMLSPSVVNNGGKTATSIDVLKSPSIILLTRKGTETVDPLKSPSVIFLGNDENKIKNALSSPSLLLTKDSKTKFDMPMNMIVGQENIKTALILLAVNPRIGGVVISGGKGTAKSVLARALHRVMPPIEVVKGSEYNISPDSSEDELDDFLLNRLKTEGKSIRDLETEIVPCPFVQVPVNVMDDRLFGSVDVKKTLEKGDTVFTPGLLASAHRGILYIDDINLLDTELVTLMLQAISNGFVMVEKEGVSVRYPCRPMLIATFNPEDSELSDAFLDRIGIAISTDGEPLTVDERVEAVNKVMEFTEKSIGEQEMQNYIEKEEQLKSAIVFAREYLKNTKVSNQQLRYLCEESLRGGCEGHRAEIIAAKVAMSSAALEDAPVRADDLRLGVKLAIIPRSKFLDRLNDEEMLPPPPPPPKAPQPQNSNADENDNTKDEDEKEDEDDEKDDEKEDEDQEELEQPEPSIPEEFMFEAVGVALDDDMMKFGGKQKTGKGGKGAILYSRDRGRYIRAVLPKEGQPLRVAIDATLREAAKNQHWRRKEAAAIGKDPTKIYLEPSDIRSKLMARKAGSLLIFAVDASGSMALNRMNAAKGAACGLLTEAYQSRDKVALITFQGQKAEVLLPPTRSISMAKNRLDVMPCGGGSPMAHALTQAVRTGVNAMSTGDVGRCVIVLITDGRANVPLDVSLGTGDPEEAGAAKKLSDAEKKEQRNKLKDEVIAVAKQIGSMSSFKLLVIDTENKFVTTGMAKEIAEAAGGRYHYIPKASADAMKKVTVDAVASLKKQR